MLATDKGIDLGERETLAILGFCGSTAALAQVVFKIKGKKLIAFAANGRAAVEYTGKNDGGADGEYPVSRSFLELCAAGAVEGSKHVPAQIARLLFDNTSIGAAVLVSKESGKEGPTLSNPDKIEPSAQLKFKEVHDLVDFDPDRKGHWFATSAKHMKPVLAIEAAANKCPVTWIPAADELSPIGFMAKGDGGEWRGILRPVEVAGPGKAATNPEPDEDDDDDRQPSLFQQSEGNAGGEKDDGVISDDEAKELAKQHGKKPKAKVKSRSKATN
jgi:hypothetical protein